MPTTTTRFLQLVRNSNSPLMNRLIAHQTTFLQIKVPISKGAICPNHGGPLQVLVLLVSNFKRLKQKACVLIVVNCPTCKTCFTNEHLLKQTTTKFVTLIGIQLETLNPTKIENRINTPNSLPFPKSNTIKVDLIVLTLTLLKYQSHFCAHSKSCFKTSTCTPFGIVGCFAYPQIHHFNDNG
jgi:hypothetical protein